MKQLTYGSLFTGIGGLDLGLHRAGLYCLWQVEKDEYRRAILAQTYPDIQKYEDVTKLTGFELAHVDVIVGGFPCPPVSLAGKRKAQEDERWLWPHFYRLIRRIRPRFVIVENVPGLLIPVRDGQPAPISDILRDLSKGRYDAEWETIPASAFGAPHLRERAIIVAYSRKERIQRFFTQPIQKVQEFSWCQDIRSIEDLRNRSDLPQSLICGTDDGGAYWIQRLEALGDMVVPALGEYLGRSIYHACKESTLWDEEAVS